MSYALISPDEGFRVCQIVEQKFPIAAPLFWAECSTEVTPDWTYLNGVFIEPTPVE